MSHLEHVAVVGAGHGGTAVAALLRQHGFQGRVTLLGAEAHHPYQRPPLSKVHQKGLEIEAELLRPEKFFLDQDIDLRLGAQVNKIDRRNACLSLADGDDVPYDRLVLATGARARRPAIPGVDLPQVLTLRTLDDAQWLHHSLGPGIRVAIVGAGYIGLEVAAVARESGAIVTILEGSDRVLGRSAGADVAEWLTERHRSCGTEVVLGAQVRGFAADAQGNLTSVKLRDREIACDLAVLGVGAEPRVEIAVEAGFATEQGITVDSSARTRVPNVYAVGDATLRPLPLYGGLFRLESIPSTTEQARQVVAHVMGLEAPKAEVPWFWSDQFDLKLQIAGIPSQGVKAVVRGETDSGRFAVYHLDEHDRLAAVEAVNASSDFAAGKRLISTRSALSPGDLNDRNIPLKDLVKRATK